MSTQAAKPFITVEEYLRLEEKAEVRHEYFDGEIFAMAGGAFSHAQIASNLIMAFVLLAGKGCGAWGSDLAVKIPSGLITYPDVSVACDPVLEQQRLLLNPIALFEILSESTEAYDRGTKFAHYQQLPSLQAYVLIAQDRMRVEVFTPNLAGHWGSYSALTEADDALTVAGVSLTVAAIYKSVTFDEQPRLHR